VNAPASRTFEHCREWVVAGEQVTVITCAPNFPQGKVYEGYRNRLWQAEMVEGIRVIRVWTYITANTGFFKRVLDYLSFMFAAILASLFVRKVDVVVGTSPQFFTACAASVVGFFKRRPWVFEVRDIWPESIKAVGAMNDSLVIRILERIEKVLYRSASRIVVVTQAFKPALVAKGADPEKIHVITNGVDLSRFAPMPKPAELMSQLGLADRFVAGYIGTHGMAHALQTLLEAARLLQDTPEGEGIHFLFLGNGARKDALIRQSSLMGLRNVLFLDSVPKDEVAKYWSLLDVSVIHLRRTELFGAVIPSKLFECMGMGIPVLHGVAGESADIVMQEQVGLVFEPENATALVQAVLDMRANAAQFQQFRQNALAAAGRYDRKHLAMVMLKVLRELAPK
jgi:glycosyltransferase involved in cell wall biosynthesis